MLLWSKTVKIHFLKCVKAAEKGKLQKTCIASRFICSASLEMLVMKSRGDGKRGELFQ